MALYRMYCHGAYLLGKNQSLAAKWLARAREVCKGRECFVVEIMRALGVFERLYSNESLERKKKYPIKNNFLTHLSVMLVWPADLLMGNIWNVEETRLWKAVATWDTFLVFVLTIILVWLYRRMHHRRMRREGQGQMTGEGRES